ncbi:hypothetical protein BDV23DRAFT_151655 [Aspergillus alliaceus]|uniref:Uncharacterized protein n=1 Tax=Petromyces alliaceus TaxID=209559 RepID=A0A5N7CF17_PETAA|nr:hypothetical protein BDV23DRAFT_151655 [Aspergillus alliaceus]
MTDSTGSTKSLLDVVRDDTFTDLSDKDAVDLFKNTFGPELEHLKKASPTVESSAIDSSLWSPSKEAFGKNFHEVNRTLVSMLAIKWVLGGDYEAFTCGQNEKSKLREDSFKTLRKYCRDRLPSPEDKYALLVAMMIDDIGKDKNLAKEVGMPDKNHGEVLLRAVEMDRVPAMRTLPDQDKKADIIQSLRIGSKLDISQLVQGETAPHSLLALKDGHKLEKGFNIKAMVTFLDVGGAAAHSNPRGCTVITEPIFRHYMKAIEILDDYRKRTNPNWPECYNDYLDYRAGILKDREFVLLSVRDQEQRALLRLLCMGRVETKEDAERFQRAFENLADPFKKNLVNGLSVNGFGDGTAILPYYAPGILVEVLRNILDPTEDRIILHLSVFMRFLAGVYGGSKPDPTKEDGLEERDLAQVQDLVRSAKFKEDPESLALEKVK